MRVKAAISLLAAGLVALHVHDGRAQDQSAVDERREAPAKTGSEAFPLRASTLIAMGIEDRAGREVGEVKDALVHLPSGKIPYLVVSLGSLLGPDLHSLPLSALDVSRHGKTVRLLASGEEVRGARRFWPSEWPDLDNTALWSGAYPVDDEQRAIREKSVFRATDIIGEQVEDRRGEKVGIVRDAIIDIERGHASHLVMQFDAGLFSSERTVAIPVTAFAAPPARPHTTATLDSLVLDMSVSELRSLPRIDAGTRPGVDTR